MRNPLQIPAECMSSSSIKFDILIAITNCVGFVVTIHLRMWRTDVAVSDPPPPPMSAKIPFTLLSFDEFQTVILSSSLNDGFKPRTLTELVAA